jgi:hypothetical protein
MDRASLMTADQVADSIREHAWREMSLRLADALKADTPDPAELPGLRRENRSTTARRRARANPQTARAGAE